MIELSQIHEGTDGYLFLIGGHHGVLKLFTQEKFPSPNSINNFYTNTINRASFCQDNNIFFLTCVFPDKLVTLRHKLNIVEPVESVFESSYSHSSYNNPALPILYPIDVLNGNIDFFTRTDTHYSTQGCIAVARHLIHYGKLGIVHEYDALLEEALIKIPTFIGDLGRKIQPHQRSELAYGLNKSILPHTDTASNGIIGNDGLLLLRKTPGALTNKTLLIFGDSFFRQMLPVLSLVYSRIVFCRTRYFHYEIVRAVGPDSIFCGVAERYLSSVSLDGNRPHFFTYPLLRGKTLTPDEAFPRLWPEFFQNDRLL